MKQCATLLLLFFISLRLFAGTGGPDSFGYTWKDSAEPTGPPYSWIDILAFPTATEVKLLGDDNSRGPFTMNFNFNYYWYDVNNFWVGSNGYIMFQDGQCASPFPTFPSSSAPNDMIGAFMNDLTFVGIGDSAECWYWINSGKDTLIVSWIHVGFFDIIPSGFSGDNTFQIILSTVDSSITFQYKEVDPTNPVQFIGSRILVHLGMHNSRLAKSSPLMGNT